MIKILEISGMKRAYVPKTMAICIKSKANIKLNQEKYKAITLKSVRRQGCPHSLYLFNMLLEDVARVICNMTTE